MDDSEAVKMKYRQTSQLLTRADILFRSLTITFEAGTGMYSFCNIEAEAPDMGTFRVAVRYPTSNRPIIWEMHDALLKLMAAANPQEG